MTVRRIQSRVNVASTPIPPVMPVRVGLLQRTCACGGTPGTDGECAERRRKQLIRQARSATQADPSGVPPIVHDVLNSCTPVRARPGAGGKHPCARPTDDLPVQPDQTSSTADHWPGRRRAASAAIGFQAAKEGEVNAGRRNTQPAEKYYPDNANEPLLHQREVHRGSRLVPATPHVQRRSWRM